MKIATGGRRRTGGVDLKIMTCWAMTSLAQEPALPCDLENASRGRTMSVILFHRFRAKLQGDQSDIGDISIVFTSHIVAMAIRNTDVYQVPVAKLAPAILLIMTSNEVLTIP